MVFQVSEDFFSESGLALQYPSRRFLARKPLEQNPVRGESWKRAVHCTMPETEIWKNRSIFHIILLSGFYSAFGCVIAGQDSGYCDFEMNPIGPNGKRIVNSMYKLTNMPFCGKYIPYVPCVPRYPKLPLTQTLLPG